MPEGQSSESITSASTSAGTSSTQGSSGGRGDSPPWYTWFISTPFRQHFWMAFSIVAFSFLLNIGAAIYGRWKADEWAKHLLFGNLQCAASNVGNNNSN